MLKTDEPLPVLLSLEKLRLSWEDLESLRLLVISVVVLSGGVDDNTVVVVPADLLKHSK